MTLLSDLPENVVQLLQTALVTEFATVSSAGVPIDTPVSYFNPEDLATIDIATGLSYPAKAERARKNPKVGLLIEGEGDEPVVSIAGRAVVKDSDLQANADLYISETAFSRPGNMDWEVAHKAIWYWTRMIVHVQPVRVMWWENHAEMDGPPGFVSAPEDAEFQQSDPAPAGAVSAANKWPIRAWRDLIAKPLQDGIPGHLTLCDEEGFPLPMPVSDLKLTDAGVELRLPGWIPWKPAGKASLTFRGVQTFVGDLSADGRFAKFAIERALPIHPFVADMTTMWTPEPDMLEAFMSRLNHEVERRGQAIPTISPEEPEPSAGAKLRIAKFANAWFKS